MPLILPDRPRLILPDQAAANFADHFAPDLLWLPNHGDIVGYQPDGDWVGNDLVQAPMGPALEHNNSLFPHYLGQVDSAIGAAEHLTEVALFRCRSTSGGSSSPYTSQIVGCLGSSNKGFGFTIGYGTSGGRYTLAHKWWQDTSAYAEWVYDGPVVDNDQWYLGIYARRANPDPGYAGQHVGLWYAWDTQRLLGGGTDATQYSMEPTGATGANYAIGSWSDSTGYAYCQVALYAVSRQPTPDPYELAEDIFRLFAPRRPRFYLPSYGGAYTGSGGITFGGGGLYSFTGQHVFEYTGSGGLTFGGGSLYAKTKAPPANTAGLLLGGSAATALYEGPQPYALGATFELTSTATYTVGATFELDAPSYTVGATFELTSTTTYTVGATFELYGSGTDAASQEASVLWQPYVTVGGVDLSARIVGEIGVDTDEMAAPLVTFTLAPTAGVVDPMAYLNAPVEVWWRHMTNATTERYRRQKFTGSVLATEWDADLALLSFDCSGDLQTKFERMEDADVARICAGYWSEHIFDEDADGWQQAQDRLSTTENVVWQDETGAIRLTSIRAKATPDFTFTDAGRIHETLRISHVAQRDLKNTVRITLDYRFPRKRHRQIKYSWMPFAPYGGVCDYLENPYTLCTRDMVQSAADGSGWVVQGDIHYVDVWAPGLYMCGFANSEPRVWGFEDVQVTTTVDSPGSPAGTYTYKQSQDLSAWCIGAWWTNAKRWVQSITETYTITVQAPQSIAHVGEALATEDYGVESEAAYDDWAESLGQDGPPTGGTAFTLPSGDTAIDGSADDPVNRTAMEYAQETVIAAARGDILRTHRGTTVEVEIPYHPGISLDHTVKLDTGRLVAQGKVRRIEDRLNVETGEAITRLSLAISRKLGSGTVTDTPVAAPPSAPAPTDPSFDGHVSLQTHIGGRTTSPVEDEDWTGFFSDYQHDPTASPDWSVNPANPAVVRYGTKFVVRSPDIDGAWVNAQVSAAAAVYDVDIPDDTLTLTAP